MEVSKQKDKLASVATLEEAVRYLRLTVNPNDKETVKRFICDVYHLTGSDLERLIRACS